MLRDSMRRKRLLHTLLIFGTIVSLIAAVRLTYELVVRPYGWTVWSSSSDESYFNWTPQDTIPGKNGLLILGSVHKVNYRIPAYQPWMDELREWSYEVFSDEMPTLQQVDSLLVWWHGIFQSFPVYSTVIPNIIPFNCTDNYFPPSYVNKRMLCGSQAFIFRSILQSRGIVTRSGALHVDARARRPLGHSTVEVWVPELEKWVYVDQMIGVRLELVGNPLSLVEVVRLYESGRLSDITVFSMNEYTPWSDFRFPMRYMSSKNFADFFHNAGIHYSSSEMFGLIEDEFPRYSIGYSSYSSEFDPSIQDLEAFRFKYIVCVGLWITSVGFCAISVFMHRRQSTDDI